MNSIVTARRAEMMARVQFAVIRKARAAQKEQADVALVLLKAAAQIALQPKAARQNLDIMA